MTIRERLRAIRRTIFDQLEATETPKALFELQSAIATEIQKSERAVKKDETGEHKWHIHLLRCYGDAIAWRLLNPHTIRQLAKNPAPPPSLIGQGRSFQYTLELAQKYADDGTPILITDITNCIKIGDIINCHDPERPIIYECKTNLKPEQIMQGRTGRQLSRAMKITEYLYKRKARLYGEERTSITVETSVEAEFTWDAVNQAVNEALCNGEGMGIASEYDMVWAYLADKEYSQIPQQVRGFTSKFKTGCLGCHARALDAANPLIPPPAVWPIDRHCRFALMELEVLLIHFIDVSQFAKTRSKDGRLVKILSDKAGINGFVVEAKGKQHTVLWTFLEDVLYGFHTIESTARRMIELGRHLSEFEPSPIPTKPSSIHKPKLIVIRTEAEDAQFLEGIHAYSSEDFVAVSQTLYNRIIHRLRKSPSEAQKQKK